METRNKEIIKASCGIIWEVEKTTQNEKLEIQENIHTLMKYFILTDQNKEVKYLYNLAKEYAPEKEKDRYDLRYQQNTHSSVLELSKERTHCELCGKEAPSETDDKNVCICKKCLEEQKEGLFGGTK